MKVGLVIPSYPNEKRVALLPQDIAGFKDVLVVEKGFGKTNDISDVQYEHVGCVMAERREIFDECDVVFALKLLQPSDYELIREGQMIIGWVHPGGSGAEFMRTQALPKKLRVVDLDSTNSRWYYCGNSGTIPFVPRNFLSKNSFYAGFSSSMHAFLSYGAYPDPKMKIAVLGSGNTAQGVFHFLSKFTDNIRMYYRKTMDEFKVDISSFDVIVNGIEVDLPNYHLITKAEIAKTKCGCFFIDAAADAGNTIEGTKYTRIDNPIYEEDGRFFYVVNNSPSLIYRTASAYLSAAFAEHVFRDGVDRFEKCFEM